MGIEQAIDISAAAQFEEWMAAHHASERELWAAIFKKSTKKQIVSFDDLLGIAICWGWIDVQTKGIDDERYGIRFVPRNAGSNWSPTNRALACRLIVAGRMKPSGSVLLPADLKCD